MDLALSMVVLLVAACLQGFTGFGYSLLSLPLLVLFMPVRTAVPLLCVTSIFLNLIIFLEARKFLDIKRIIPLIIAGVVSLPAGVWLLGHGSEALLRTVVGVLVTLSAAIYLTGFRIRIRNEKLAFIPVGIISGVMNGVTGFSGPPVILFLTNQAVSKQAFRANISAYFLVLNIAAVPVFIAGGMLTGDVAIGILYRFPVVIAGVLAGVKLAGSVSEKRFLRLSLILLGVLGLVTAGSGAGLF